MINLSHLILDFLAIGAIICSILVITSKNPVISVLFLICLFVFSACYLLVLGVGFVGLSYLIIYVGAIAVLFLFVIMMINIKLVDLLEVGSEYTQNLPLGFIIIILFFYEMFNISPIIINFDNLYIISAGIWNFLNNLFLLYNKTYYSYLELYNIANNTTIFSIPSNILYLNWMDDYLYNFIQIETLGNALYTYSSILLFISGLILLLAMIGPIVLSMKLS